MIESSRFCAFCKAFASAFMQSRFYAFMLSIVNFFSRAYSTSSLKRILVGSGDIERYAQDSAFYRGIKKILNPVISFFTGICRAASEGTQSSIAAKIYGIFFSRSLYANAIYFISFVCVFIFVIPHNFWSNMFGLVFAAALIVLYIISASNPNKALAAGTNANGIWFSLIVFSFSLLVSCFVSYDRADSVRVLLFFVTSLVLCMTVYACLRDENGLDVMGGFRYGCLIFTSLLAFAQRVLGIEADASLTDLTLNKDMPGRVFSTLGNPNNYAEFLVLFMPFAMSFVLGKKKWNVSKLLLCAGMLLPLGAILMTYARSGWIALAIAAAVFVMLYDKRLIPVFIILAIFAIPFIPQNIWNRILTIGNLDDTSSSYRLDIWSGCLKMLKDYWFTGVGLGTGGFAEIYPQYAVGESGIAPHSHMHFMEMISELGILGFISYVCLTFSLIRRSFVSASAAVPFGIRRYAVACAAGMTGIILIGCFEYCWFYPRVMFAFFICAGIAMAVHRLAGKARQNG